MATGPEMLQRVCELGEQSQGSQIWLDLREKLDLSKLKAQDLVQREISEQEAERIVQALNNEDLSPLGAALGLKFRVKFRVFALRDSGGCLVRCEQEENARYLRSFLSARLPSASISEIRKSQVSPFFELEVPFDKETTPYEVRNSLRACPGAILMELYDLEVHEQPHYRLPAIELAKWLNEQGDQMWTIDGERGFMSKMLFPAAARDVANLIGKEDRYLLVVDPDGIANGESITASQISQLLEVDEIGAQALYLSWEDSSVEWELVSEETVSV